MLLLRLQIYNIKKRLSSPGVKCRSFLPVNSAFLNSCLYIGTMLHFCLMLCGYFCAEIISWFDILKGSDVNGRLLE